MEEIGHYHSITLEYLQSYILEVLEALEPNKNVDDDIDCFILTMKVCPSRIQNRNRCTINILIMSNENIIKM